MDTNADYRIIATAEDAILAKHATAQAKYYRDPFVEAFAHAANLRQQNRQRHFQPIIKRGTHARVCCMDRAITSFLKMNKSESQVVVLGAGKDTSYFRYITKSLMGMEEYLKDPRKILPPVHWYEVDHPNVIQEKAKTIQGSAMLSQCCPQFHATSDKAGFQSLQYHLVSADLRESPDQLLDRLKLNPKRPTLFVLECVFMYMPNESTKSLLEALATRCKKAWIALYEPILGTERDTFGNMMQQNLVKAKVASPDCCLLQTRTLSAQLEKLVNAGFSANSVGCDMWSAYETIITPEQRKQANQAEFLDEIEEWMLIMRHYCFILATNVSDDPLTSVGTDSQLGFLPGKSQSLAKQD